MLLGTTTLHRTLKALILAFAALPAAAQSQVDAPDLKIGFALKNAFPAQPAFRRPVYLDHDLAYPDSYFVLEQAGRILRIPRDGARSDRDVFLDWRWQTLSPDSGGHNEEGLLGFVFDPKHNENGYVYIYYSQERGRSGQQRSPMKRRSVVSRLTVLTGNSNNEGDHNDEDNDGANDEDKNGANNGRPVVDPDSELVILTVDQPHGNHNGGTILFGPDRLLYVVLGDGGGAGDPHGNGQNLATLLGSILRIDVRGATKAQPYQMPEDNPFRRREGARGEIWAHGLRNPWRISFDRKRGDLWCGDVGQNRWEEVNRIVRGGNYGWNYMEGTHAFAGGHRHPGPRPDKLLPPIAEYGRDDGISVIGGYVYRGQKVPALLGRYIYADYATGNVWAVKEARSGGNHEVVRILRRGGTIASFAQEPDGEILALRFDGHIYRLVQARSPKK
ncbi:MAG: PQQ-dependent sugar dehydrogenase [Planctomycetota bacterium]|jgi:hypothetical protein